MASTNQELQQSASVRNRQRRLALLALAAFILVAWGPRMIDVLVRGWQSSCLALERQQQIDEAELRIEALHRELIYARTTEGKDVEAKRRFGVGPRDEIWITVDAEKAPEQRPAPQSVADRVDLWLHNAGSRFVDRVRDVGVVFSYWVGLHEVDRYVAVPVIEDEVVTDADEEDAAGADAPSEGGDDDDEAAEDGEDAQ